MLVGLVVAALAYPGLRVWTGRGYELPPTSWGSVIVLVFMAFGVFFAALPIRRFLRGQARKPLNPLRAMRTLVLAQAAALTGALVAGWYLAQVLVLWPDLDIGSVRAVALRLAASVAAGVLLAMAGLLAQAMCRVDKVEKAEKGNSGNRDDGRDRDDWGDDGDREDDEDDEHDNHHRHH
jgi:amino acid transporter